MGDLELAKHAGYGSLEGLEPHMNTFYRAQFPALLLGAAFVLLPFMVHAQSEEARPRDKLVINQGGYAGLEKQPTQAEQAFADKTKIVRDAYRKREIKKYKDEQALPAGSTPRMRTVEGPLR